MSDASRLVDEAKRLGETTYKEVKKEVTNCAEKGLPDQNAFGACMTVIDPSKADDDPGLITVLPDVEAGAEYLAWLRKR